MASVDKIYFCGSVTCVSFERFGMDVQVEDDLEKKDIIELGFDKPWITDHLVSFHYQRVDVVRS
jgi:tyrosyl-DNA phosphodiesterase 2